MSRYSSLIRKLVKATSEMELKGDDVVGILKERCFNDTDIIRQTLMNAVCDPRFKYHAKLSRYWREEAVNALEQLVEQLTHLDPLNSETAYNLMDNFLSIWFEMNFKETNRAKVERIIFSPSSRNGEEAWTKQWGEKEDEEQEIDLSETQDYLNGIGEELAHPKASKLEQLAQSIASGRTPSGDEKNGAEAQAEADNDQGDDHEDRTPKEENQEEDDAGNGSGGNNGDPTKGHGRTNFQTQRKLEDDFLKKIPSSLVELAKQIGRADSSPDVKSGKFLRSAKSDIAGITTGNDLHSLVPTELALLSDPQTEDIFFRRYTEEQLQLFASASQSSSPKKHQDGPVIICVDTSSSMEGLPVSVAKALSIAVAIIAWRRKRDVIMVKYSNDYDYINLGNSRAKFKQMTKFLSIVSMGSNNENDMFQWLFTQVKPSLKEYETADILCVSDFGWGPILSDTMSILQAEKERGMKFYGLNVDKFRSEYADLPLPEKEKIEQVLGKVSGIDADTLFSPYQICDSLWMYNNGECVEVKVNETV